MDWPLAIDKNRERLLRIVIALMALIGLFQDKRSAVQDKRSAVQDKHSAVDYGGKLTTLPFHLYRQALNILRPAESAVRRLIMMAAYDMELRGIKLPKLRAKVLGPKVFSHRPATTFPDTTSFAPSFNLIEPLKPYTEEAPDYSNFGPKLDNEGRVIERRHVQAATLGRRLLALKLALNAIPKQARRLTRWYVQRDQAIAQNRLHRFSPLRPGFPPGYRRSRRQIHDNNDIMSILLDCHYFAHETLQRRDSS